MKNAILLTRIRLSFGAALALIWGVMTGSAQTTLSVTSNAASGAGSLLEAISTANGLAETVTINIADGIGPISPAAQFFINTTNLTINGNGTTIDMLGADRAFFIVGGTVQINNLIIQNGNATGGAGADAGGGGAGLGGAIFVANGMAIPNAGSFTGTGPNPTVVTLSNVGFFQNQAVGGLGAEVFSSSPGLGGGGGMGGSGGIGYQGTPSSRTSGGGGGGFGIGSAGGPGNTGTPTNGASGAFYSGLPGGGGGGSSGGDGGSFGGGGGGGDAGGFIIHDSGAGGGGGVGGGAGGEPYAGGGGGAVYGFGGGGGNGGFGGGGGAGGDGNGGFGGGTADPSSAGGGGAGLGGAIFVMNGASLTIEQAAAGPEEGSTSFAGSSVLGGASQGYSPGNGSAYGADLFLGGNVTFHVTSEQTLSVNNLGGAGNTADPNVIGNDPNAQGGLALQGGGTLSLTGTANFYSGQTIVNNGTLSLAPGALEQGTSSVVIGQNLGDSAVFQMGSGSTLALGGFNGASGTDQPIVIAQDAGSTGVFKIGNGSESNGGFLGARIITGGAGSATVQFNQNFAAEGGNATVYPFYTTLTGSLAVNQSGPGTTLLQPLFGDNTYSGGTVIAGGTLQLGAANALPASAAVAISSGGTLDLNGSSASMGNVTLDGGAIITSTGNASFSATTLSMTSGTINAAVSGATNLAQSGNGTTTLGAGNSYTGSTTITGGTLVAGVAGALGTTSDITISSGGTLLLTASDALPHEAALSLNGGTLATMGGVLWEDLGVTIVTDNSVLDLSAEDNDFVFASLTLTATLSIWNWNNGNESLLVSGASVFGPLTNLEFYSDSGATFIGTGALAGIALVPIPEPSAAALACLAFALAASAAFRRRG